MLLHLQQHNSARYNELIDAANTPRQYIGRELQEFVMDEAQLLWSTNQFPVEGIPSPIEVALQARGAHYVFGAVWDQVTILVFLLYSN